LEDVPIMGVLLAGRVLGGISTSLLFSAFESWMVTEHRARGGFRVTVRCYSSPAGGVGVHLWINILRAGFEEALLGKTFALGSEINGVVAVVAGLVAQVTADAFGDIGPFRAAVAITTIAAACVCSWPENFGSPAKDDDNAKAQSTKKSEDREMKRSGSLTADAYALGICYSLFEGAMYVFGKLRLRDFS
jgi:hypothetical protein